MSNDDSIPVQKDESQQAFLRYLPRRIVAFEQRLQRYRSEGWDPRGMTVLRGDLLRLGDASSHHGMLEACRNLLVLARMIGEHVANETTPDPQQAWRMFAQLTKVTESLQAIREHQVQSETGATTHATDRQPSVPEGQTNASMTPPVAEASVPVAAAIEAVDPVAPVGQIEEGVSVHWAGTFADVDPVDAVAPIESAEPIALQPADPSVADAVVETAAPIEPIAHELAESPADTGIVETVAPIEPAEPIAQQLAESPADTAVVVETAATIEQSAPITQFEPEDVAEPIAAVDPVETVISPAPEPAAPVEPSAQDEMVGTATPVEPFEAVEENEAVEAVEAVDLSEMDEPHVASESGMRRVYYLNDGNAFAIELGQRLESEGYAIEPVESVEELSELLMCLVPQMLLVDASHMSELGAIDRIRRDMLQRSQTQRRIQVVALAAHDNLEARRVAHRAEVDVLLFPPFDIADVVARLRALDTVVEEQPMRVLIVDDERTDALFAQMVLAKAGMEAHVQGNPMRVLESIKELHPDLILMDLHMPFVNGVEVTMLIREDPVFARLPIVFLSGESDPDSRLEAINAGGDDFLFKPIRPRHLIAAVRERMRRMHPVSKPGPGARPTPLSASR